jgi:hypothetical protein
MTLQNLRDAFAGALLDASGPVIQEEIPECMRLPAEHFRAAPEALCASDVDALQRCYPALVQLVGRDYFRFLAREYILKHVPNSSSLFPLWNGFPRYLRHIERLHGLACLSDVAELELMLIRAYLAGEGSPMTVADFAQISLSRVSELVIQWHPSADLFVSPFPAVSMWRAVAVATDARDPSMAVGGDSALVVRPRDHVCVVPVPHGVDLLLALLMRGHLLGEAAEGSQFADPSLDLRQSLKLLMESGAVAGIRLGPGRGANAWKNACHEQVTHPLN